MAVVKIKTPDLSENVKTYLSDDYTSGSTLTVESTTGFANGNYLVVGEPGLEKSEVTKITAAPGVTTLTVDALDHDHPSGTPVYFTRWDKYELDYATTSTGAWVTYGSMPAEINFDTLYTEYRDTLATSTYQWRYRYYSTEQLAYSDYSDTITSTGWVENSVGYMVRNVRKIANDPDGKTISDAEIIRFFNGAQGKIYTLYKRWWFLYKEGSAIDTAVSTAKYGLPDDFGRLKYILYNFINGDEDTNYQLRFISETEYNFYSRDNDAADDDAIKYYTIVPGDSTNSTGYIKVWPRPATAGLHMTPWYYKTFDALDSYGDLTEVPIPSMLEDYALAQIFKIRGEEARADYYDGMFRQQIDLLKLMQQKNVGQPQVLWKWQGRKAINRLYGDRSNSTDSDNEANW